ncbi:lysine-sensitive aspartokinase 3 [Paraneptunicella aestuarii]|uniref:lysine-sensitive aspartokinase 3 n=1 Tax=Paraneptunicella aestuarii TaxID=2831148 RepID=UPI001E4C8968|nr:lysine-sensitive aspartokinase 3 [Paraneptunicella aestuarii]UAA39037.1 lysine-sensitive aspartokinase 3 [Paraneptunicella aestuarii]
MALTIAKFGGTSVASYEAMQNCVRIVNHNPSCKLVVTSAPAGITNHLVSLGRGGLSTEQRDDIIEKIRTQVSGICEQLKEPELVKKKMMHLLADMEQIALVPELPNSLAFQDKLLCYGERLASLLLTACINESGKQAVEFDVRTVMRTDNNFGSANPDIEVLAELAKEKLQVLLKDSVVVTQGFIGETEDGQTTTLGRGGSDYTAALLSEALKARKCEIWTDVPGVFSTDPRIVSDAYPLPELSYDEAAEMANFGAKVLHPATLAPTLRNNIPVFVGSTKNPELGGTTIVKDCQEEPTFRAITRRGNQQLVTLHTPKLERASQFIGKVFQTLDNYGLSIDLITTSETSISLTFNAVHESNLAEASKLALADLANICVVEVTPNLDLITIVGNKLHAKNGSAGEIFEVLRNVRIRMICYGANPHNISFLVEDSESTEVIKNLHKSLL